MLCIADLGSHTHVVFAIAPHVGPAAKTVLLTNSLAVLVAVVTVTRTVCRSLARYRREAERESTSRQPVGGRPELLFRQREV
jgi:hypothetical protein